jgi:hypothetical protein
VYVLKYPAPLALKTLHTSLEQTHVQVPVIVEKVRKSHPELAVVDILEAQHILPLARPLLAAVSPIAWR